MRRVHRQIARDVARAAGAPLAQLIAVRGADTATLGVDGPALRTPALRRAVASLLARAPGHGSAAAVLEDGAAWATAPCEPELSSLLWPRGPPAEARSAFFRMDAPGPEPLLLRLVLPRRPRRAELRALEAIAQLASDRLVKRERRSVVALRQARDTLAALQLAGAHLTAETDEAAIYGVLTRELGRLGFHCGVLAPEDGGTALGWRVISFPARLRRAVERVVGTPLAALRIDPLEAPRLRRCLSGRRSVRPERPRSAAVREVLGAASPEQVRRLGRLLAVRQLILAPLRRDGRPVAILVVASPRQRTGEAEAIEAFALQASLALEKARLFAALREERAHLESEVARRTAELRRAVAALEENDRRKDNFLANISHELRTPLVTVLGYAELVLGEKLGPLTPRQRTALQVVATSGRRLKAFIEELLDLSRHEITRHAYAFAPVEIGEVLTQGVLALAPRFAERGLRVRARVARGTPRAWADHDRMLQVVVNLLANAERYTPDGGSIRVAAAAGPDRVVISIVDRGAGIAEEHLANLFDRLYQVRDDRSPRHRGGALGIGLALVKSIVEAHGGQVKVRSRVGRGTRFRLWIPTAEAGQRASAGAAAEDPGPAARRDP